MPVDVKVMQDEASAEVTLACRIVDDDNEQPQTNLIPGEWVLVGHCEPGTHYLRMGGILGSGHKDITLTLDGATYYGETTIIDRITAPTDGNLFELEVSA